MTVRNSLYALPPGAPFARTFAAGFVGRFGHLAPEEVARVSVFVNTNHARQAIEHALADAMDDSRVMPRLVMMSELYADPLRLPDTPLAVSATRRRLRLTRLVEAFLSSLSQTGDQFAPEVMAVDLADSLAMLIDQFHDEGVDPDALDSIVESGDLASDSAIHWKNTLQFVDIVRRAWPSILAETEDGRLDPRARQRAVITDLLDKWQKNPPEHPIIAAASTGSVGSTAELLAGLARLPHGHVVLPGFDPMTPQDIWEAAGADHPLGPFRKLFSILDTTPPSVTLWHGQGAGPRAHLLTQALRPAPVTDHWHDAAREIGMLAPNAVEGLSILEARSPQEEAEAIAIAIRAALDVPRKTIALITPDASLARRVTAALTRYDVIPDDTLGRPLLQSPSGVLMRLVARLAERAVDPVGLAALLQHPLAKPGIPRSEHLSHARAYERAALRGLVASDSKIPDWPDADEAQRAWLSEIRSVIGCLQERLEQGSSFADLLDAHVEALTRLTRPAPEEPAEIWSDDAGRALRDALSELSEDADAYGTKPLANYEAMLLQLLSGLQTRPKPRESHPRVSISGPREARLISADLVILAGLEDGVWPAIPDPGPWLSRPMFAAAGLPMPERLVGLSAHDFLHSASGAEVILSRSRRRDGAATVASRWLIRLETLIKGVGCEDLWQEITKRGDRWIAEVRHAASAIKPTDRAARPAPVPPLHARPRRLSVTGIELLVRDAYAIYARDILRLRVLEPIGRVHDARDRGNWLHAVLERFVKETQPWPGKTAAREKLRAIADRELKANVARPDLRRVWRARLARATEWFISSEEIRRTSAEPVALESAGSLTLNLPGGEFEVTAKADRIDRTLSGHGVVYDYKTGAPPTQKQIDLGFNHQIHLQAAILGAGGFEDAGKLEPDLGAYLGFTGSGDGGEERRVADLADQTAVHVEQIKALLIAYDSGAPYVARGRPQYLHYAGDYDHLSRAPEWMDEDQS